MQVTFFDESGVDPVPPGVRVTFYPLGVTLVPANVVATATVGVGGTVATSLPAGQFFVAQCVGVQMPTTTNIFQTNADNSASTVVVLGYRSPTLSAAGYAAAMRDRYPKHWLDDVAPVADAVFAAVAAPLGALDTEGQILRTAMRFESCIGPLLDSWQRDYFGNTLPRFEGETDALYIARILIFTSRLRNTLAVIQSVVQTYLASTANLPYMAATLAEDTSGAEDTVGMEDATVQSSTAGTANNLGEDTQGFEDTTHGGEDTNALPSSRPTVIVFDWQSDAASSAAITLPRGAFGIYFHFDGYNNPPHVIQPYDTIVQALVNIVKPCGSPAVWCANRTF